jgi:hypothetical protein
MQKRLLGSALFVLLLGATTGCSQDSPASKNDLKGSGTTAAPAAAPAPGSDAPITDELLRLSEFAKMDYKATLSNCKKGDKTALLEFFDFHRIVEEKSAVEHSLVCLDMIAASNDAVVSDVCSSLKPKLKTLVVERLTAAQPKSAKPALQKPMSEWAPKTWAALNNLPIPDPAREAAEAAARANGKPGAQSADQMGQPAAPAQLEAKKLPVGAKPVAKPDGKQ